MSNPKLVLDPYYRRPRPAEPGLLKNSSCRHGLTSGCPRCVEEDDRVEEAYYAPLDEELETLGDENA